MPKVLRFQGPEDRGNARREAEILDVRTRLLNAATYLLSAAQIAEAQDPVSVRTAERAARLCTVQPHGRAMKIEAYCNQIAAATHAIRHELDACPLQHKR